MKCCQPPPANTICQSISASSPICQPPSSVGFGLLPNQVMLPTQPLALQTALVQVCRKAVKKGFKLNLMVVGESGLGKSTLVKNPILFPIGGYDLWHTSLCDTYLVSLFAPSLNSLFFRCQINSMFLTDIYNREESRDWQPRKTLEVPSRIYLGEESPRPRKFSPT